MLTMTRSFEKIFIIIFSTWWWATFVIVLLTFISSGGVIASPPTSSKPSSSSSSSNQIYSSTSSIMMIFPNDYGDVDGDDDYNDHLFNHRIGGHRYYHSKLSYWTNNHRNHYLKKNNNNRTKTNRIIREVTDGSRFNDDQSISDNSESAFPFSSSSSSPSSSSSSSSSSSILDDPRNINSHDDDDHMDRYFNLKQQKHRALYIHSLTPSSSSDQRSTSINIRQQWQHQYQHQQQQQQKPSFSALRTTRQSEMPSAFSSSSALSYENDGAIGGGSVETVFHHQQQQQQKKSPNTRIRTTRHRHKNVEKDFEIIGTLTGVAGGKIALPCNISTSTPKDSVTLILWYKDESTTPIYSVDARKGVSLEAARRVTDENLASRAYMNTGIGGGDGVDGKSPYAHLMLELLTPDDAGEYACRVDFRKERTRNSVIFLKIIVPPEKPQIINSNGESLPSLIGPFTEGDRLALICEVEGGKPIPTLTWWRESVLLDDTYEQVTTPSGNILVRNQLVIQSLRRQDLMAVFTCQASNNNISLPSTTTVTVDLNFRPLTVKILGERKQSLSAEKVSIITCESTGSRPPATISWWLGGTTRLRNAQEQISSDGNQTTSRLSLTVTIDDIGKEITCRAENPHIPNSAIEDTIQLEINYAPQVTLKLGSNLRHSHIQEGNDVYFECVIRSSPRTFEVRWHFEGRELQTNTSSGIIVSNQSLVLQKVKKHQRGKYTCSATNSEGDGESNAVHLRIQYAPICKAGQKIIYGAARHETVNILCELESDPQEIEFYWSYNGTGSEPRRETATLKYEPNGPQSSIGHYTPHTEFDYGTIFCWGRNQVGIQSKPCAYSIVAAGSPDPVRNCSVFNVTEDSMRVDCEEGYDGGLMQHFILEIYDTTERNSALRANVTASSPSFQLNQLQPAHTYLFVIYAANAKGRSKGIALTAFTLAMPESMNRLAKGNVWQLNFNPVLVILIAIVMGIVLIAFFIVLIFRWKTMKPPRSGRAGGGVGGDGGVTSSQSPINRYHRDMDKNNMKTGKDQQQQHPNNGSNGSQTTTTNSTTLLSSSDMSSNTTSTSTNNNGIGNDMTQNELITAKNIACSDLDDLDNTGDDVKQLTIPLNSSSNNGTTASGPGLVPGTGGAVVGGTHMIRSNIYSTSPLSTTNTASNSSHQTINNLGPNKHVTWRPDTPPSPTPNIYTQFTNVGYMPMATTNDSFQSINHPNNQPNIVPMSYSLANGLSGVGIATTGAGNGYETTFMDIPPNSATTTGYVINTNHHHVPQQQQPTPYGVIIATAAAPSPNPLQYDPYSIHQHHQPIGPVYGTIPRRVRVIPQQQQQLQMQHQQPGGIPSSSMASSSSGGSLSGMTPPHYHQQQQSHHHSHHHHHPHQSGTPTTSITTSSVSSNNTTISSTPTKTSIGGDTAQTEV